MIEQLGVNHFNIWSEQFGRTKVEVLLHKCFRKYNYPFKVTGMGPTCLFLEVAY